MRRAIIFDDGRGQLAPLTDLRPAFDIRTGAMTSLERLRLGLDLIVEGLLVPEPLAALTREMHPEVAVNDLGSVPGDVLLVNGRCPLAYKEVASLRTGEAVVEGGSGDLVAMATTAGTVRDLISGAPVGSKRIEFAAPALLSRPWHVRTFRDPALHADLALLAGRSGDEQAPLEHAVVLAGSGAGVLRVHATAKVYPGVVFDCENGSIVIDEGAVLRPACTIIGPAYIGPHSTVLDRAIIRGQTAIGPWCKVAGEVGGTIFQGYSNKAHDGHLGDSWIGEWSNLGAGTTNSNLLNTYGEVVAKATPGGSNERTGQQFLGCIVGDHVKFAIGTRIMTGAVVHTGTMWAATAPVSGCVAPFSWVTDAGTKTFRVDKFAEIARTVMGRRKVVPSGAYMARLGELHRQGERGA
jgi:UDP-N-acetylglucosamine diphosphorylase/glucosamine-1-phosphate N-acetyltransferase